MSHDHASSSERSKLIPELAGACLSNHQTSPQKTNASYHSCSPMSINQTKHTPKGCDDHDDVCELEPHGVASIPATTLNIIKNMCGAGILTLPWGVSKTGYVVGLIMLGVAFILAVTSFVMLGVMCHGLRVYTYTDLASRTWGRGTARIVEWCIFGLVLACCVLFLMFIADFMLLSVRFLTPWWVLNNRAVVLTLVVFMILFPLSLVNKLDSLKYSSMIGVFALCFTVGILVVNFLTDSDMSINGTELNSSKGIVPAQLNIYWLECLIVFTMSFNVHFNAPEYYAELKHRNLKRFSLASISAFVFVMCLNLLCAMSGYFVYGAHVDQDIINALGVGRVVVAVARLSVAIAVIGSYPLVFFALRTLTESLFFNETRRKDIKKSRRWKYMICVFYTVVFWLVAIFVSDVGIFSVFLQACFGNPTIFVFPPMFYLKYMEMHGIQSTFWRNVCYFMILFGVWTSIFGFADVIITWAGIKSA